MTKESMNEKMIRIAKQNINGTNRRKAIYKNVIMAFERVNNDMYGNPLYRVYPINFNFKHNNLAYKNYESKGYYLLQSYNIETDLARLVQNMLDTYDVIFPEIDITLLDEYNCKSLLF